MEFSLKNGIKVIIEMVKETPKKPGIYKMIDQYEKILYIGKAKNLPKRVVSYSKIENLPNRLRRMVAQLNRIDYITTTTEAEALLLEANLIKTHQPVFNIALKDDKSFPYIVIDNTHDFPRISKYRGKLRKGQTYFGPFASAGYVNQTIAEIQKIFLLRPCTDSYFDSRDRPCLQYQIKRCSAPCVDKISRDDYAASVQDTKNFLSGKSTYIQGKLVQKMEQLSEKMEYEAASVIRDRIKVLTQVQAKNAFANSTITDADLIVGVENESNNFCVQVFFVRAGKNFGNKSYYFSRNTEVPLHEVMQTFIGQFYQNHPPPRKIILNEKLENTDLIEQAMRKLAGYVVKVVIPSRGKIKDLIEFAIESTKDELSKKEKERIKNENNLAALEKLFEIDKPIKRIEIYDNSHTSGSHQVGCMVVAGTEGFEKNEYRKFNIKNSNEHDDYGMMREVLKRRLKRLNEDNYPDLMLIDGGKGQLSAVWEVMKEVGVSDIKVIAIAKGPDRNAGREKFFISGQNEFQLPKGDPTLLFLQYLRNEVHRYAIETHRAKRSKGITKSVIDEIPKIGKKRKQDLLKIFGSAEAIKNASISDIMKVEGISKKLAEEIHTFLKSR